MFLIFHLQCVFMQQIIHTNIRRSAKDPPYWPFEWSPAVTGGFSSQGLGMQETVPYPDVTDTRCSCPVLLIQWFLFAAAHVLLVTFFFNRYNNDVRKWKQFPRYCPFVTGIHWSPLDSLHKGQWSKQSIRRSFETLSRLLWRHCNEAE